MATKTAAAPAAAAAPAPAKPAAAKAAKKACKKVKKEKKVLTKAQWDRKMKRIGEWLRNHPHQLHKEKKEGGLIHLHKQKKLLMGDKKPKTDPKQHKHFVRPHRKHPIAVPECVRIRKQMRLRRVANKLRRADLQKQKDARFRSILITRAQRHMSEYRRKERSLVVNRRLARMSGNFFREPQPRLILVIRLKGIMGLTPRTRKILSLLRLRQINNATFVRVNAATLNMLRLVSPYVAFGYPNLATVRKLIYKRGYLRYHGRRVPLIDNKLIHHKLGKYNVICVEDLIHEIYTVGPNFKNVNKFLWAFKLSNPRGGFVHKSTSYVEGGDSGNREEKINELVRRML